MSAGKREFKVDLRSKPSITLPNGGSEVIPHMPNHDEVMFRAAIANPDWWAKHGAEVNKRFWDRMGQ